MYLIITSRIYIYCHVFTAQPPFSPLHNPGVPQHFESHRRLDGVEQRLQIPMENGCKHFALILVCKRKNVNLKSACSSSRHKDVPGGEKPKFWATQAWRQKDTGHDAISLNHSEPTSQHISTCAVDFSALSSRLGHLAPANIQRNPKNRNDWANAMQICTAANKSCPDDNFTNLATSK